MSEWNDRLHRDRAAYHPDKGCRRKVDRDVKPAGRKVLLDRLKAARLGLLWYMEMEQDPRHGAWWRSGKKWAEKKYDAALKACHEAGIDIKA